MGLVRERDGWKKTCYRSKKNEKSAEMKEEKLLWMLLAQLRQTENEEDEAEVLYSGGGEAARGKSAQSRPSLCSVGVGNIRQPF